MDRQIESKCLDLTENYRILAAGNKLEYTEMVLACAGIYMAAGVKPDTERLQAAKMLLKSRAGIFSNFRGSDELLVRCKMALADDPARYFDRLEQEYGKIKTFFSGEQTVLAAMILAEQSASGGLAEKTKQIFGESKDYAVLCRNASAAFAQDGDKASADRYAALAQAVADRIG